MLYSQDEKNMLPLQNPDSIRVELAELFAELSKKHPGFYRYNDKETFDAWIDSTIQSIQEPLDELAILRKAKPIIAKIACLHTGIHVSAETEAMMNAAPNCLPLALYEEQEKVFVWKKFGDTNTLNIGDQVIGINGRDIADIYKELLTNISMDGYNQSGKYKLLQYSFPQWYRSIIELTDTFRVETSNGKQHIIAGVREKELLSYEDITNEPLSLNIVEGVAIIRIPSFANSYLEKYGQSFKKEIQKYFIQIREENISKTLIDLRGNSGGSDSNPAWFATQFFSEAFRYWDKIEITEPIAQDISGMTRIYYGKPKKEAGTWRWSDKGLFSKEFKFTRPQKPAAKPFEGEVYILTDGLCMSSCSDFVAIMQYNKKAQILGEETGGGYQGNTSGLIPSEKLACGLVVDIPLLKYYNFVEKKLNLGRGTQPDIFFKPSLQETWVTDAYLQRVLERVKNSSSKHN